MLSNSKLTKVQKQSRKDKLGWLPTGSTLANDDLCLTVLCVPAGNVTRVFSSVCSDDEAKFRRKVGEYHVLSRFFDEEPGMILPGVWDAQEVLERLTSPTY